MLVASMTFVAAPLAYANDLPEQEVSVGLSQEEGASPVIDTVPDDLPDTTSNPVTEDEQPPVLQDPPADPRASAPTQSANPPSETTAGQDVALAASTVATTAALLETDSTAQAIGSSSALDKIRALLELNRALNDLYKTIKSATGPSIVRVDDGYLTAEDTTACFQEGVYHAKIVTLVNQINTLLKTCGLPHGVQVYSLPISVIGELPEGFCFEDNTLLLTDPSLLNWSADLGDEPQAPTRLYEIGLQLNTGVSYIDSWLRGKGVNGLVSEQFIIELLLIQPNGEDGDEPGTDPGIDPGPTPVDPNPPVVNPPANTVGGAASTPNTYDIYTAALVTSEPETPSTTTPADNEEPREDDSTDPSQLLNIENQMIPMASMMINDTQSATATNAVLTSLSLVLSAASLISLRQRKPSLPQSNSEAQPSRAGMLFGIVGIAMGAISATLFVLSQYLVDGSFISGIAWSPVLITVSIVQIACLVGLFASSRITNKGSKRRVRIRY